jgi:hypothetical protein
MSRHSSIAIVLHQLVKPIVGARGVTISRSERGILLAQTLASSLRRASQRRKLGLLNRCILLITSNGRLINFFRVEE